MSALLVPVVRVPSSLLVPVVRLVFFFVYCTCTTNLCYSTVGT